MAPHLHRPCQAKCINRRRTGSLRSVSCPCRSAGRTITTTLPCRRCGNSSSRRARPVRKVTRCRNCSARSSSRAAARHPRPRPALPLGQPERHRTRRFRFRNSARRRCKPCWRCRTAEHHRRPRRCSAVPTARAAPTRRSRASRARAIAIITIWAATGRYRRHQPKHDPVVLHLRRLIDQRRHQRGQQQSRRATDPDAGAIVERLVDADDRYGLIPRTRSRCGAAAACAYLTGSVAGGSPGAYRRDRSRGRHRRHLDRPQPRQARPRGRAGRPRRRGGGHLLRQCRHHRGQHGLPRGVSLRLGDARKHRAQALAARQLSPRPVAAGRALADRLPRRLAAGTAGRDGAADAAFVRPRGRRA